MLETIIKYTYYIELNLSIDKQKEKKFSQIKLFETIFSTSKFKINVSFSMIVCFFIFKI